MMPKAIHNAVVEGLQKLIALRLKGQPPQETIAATVSVWLETIEAHSHWQDTDTPRVHKAFVTLAATLTDWPSPKQFFDVLPHKPPPPRIPPPPIDPHAQAEALKILSDLTNKFTMRCSK